MSAYIEKIYNKCKKDGHFSKYDSFEQFESYFESDELYEKLWRFLTAKGYTIPDLQQFIAKIKGEEEVQKKKDSLRQPVAAVDFVTFDEPSNRKLPDIVNVGTLKHPSVDKDTPANIPFSDTGGFMFYTDKKNISETNKAMQLMAFRVLLSAPAKKVKFYLIDNEENGQSFNKLFGFDEKIVHSEIWDDDSEILEGLQDLKNDIPKIASKVLGTKYKNLIEYNEDVPHSNQQFQIVMIANFPSGFDRKSAEHLLALMRNGQKSGIYIIGSINQDAKIADGIVVSDYREVLPEYDITTNLFRNFKGVEYFNQKLFFAGLNTDIPLNVEMLKEQLNAEVNKEDVFNININDKLKGQQWTGNSSKVLCIPIGMNESNELINFELGKEAHHALIGGATGSGKTVLLHNIIIHGAQLYSPDELQFILMDYKEGTEFKVYENIPHLKILSIASEKEFGLSVFEFLVEEITNRGILFKEQNVGNIEDYRKKTGSILPRYLMLIDEFQVLLTGMTTFSTKVAELMEDISRRGRSFGINMVLSTQSLGDVDITSSTLSNIGLRIAMKMPENDCMKILSFENTVATSFTRAGQAVYNAQQGQKKGNIEFQVSFMTGEKVVQNIEELNQIAEKQEFDKSKNKQFIFDGTVASSIENNKVLSENIKNDSFTINDSFCDLYIGEPSFLQEEHCKIRIRTQQESNCLIVGDDSKAALSIIYNGMCQLIKQSSKDSVFYIFDLFAVDCGYAGQFSPLKELSENVKIYSKAKPLGCKISEIKEELERRFEEEGSPGRIVLVIINIQTIRELRKDGFSFSDTSEALFDILKDGPDYGIHSFIHSVSYNGLMNAMDSEHIKEFENKIILKGVDPYQIIDDSNLKEITQEGIAYAVSPQSKYSGDKFKTYQ